jgi:hypothetical protein
MVVAEHALEHTKYAYLTEYFKWGGRFGHFATIGLGIAEFVKNPSLETGHELALTGAEVGTIAIEGAHAVPYTLAIDALLFLGKQANEYAEYLNAQNYRINQKFAAIDEKLQSYLEKMAIERDVQLFYPTLTCSGDPVCRPTEGPSSEQAMHYSESLGPNITSQNNPKGLAFERWMEAVAGSTDLSRAEVYSGYPEFQNLYPEFRPPD